MAGATLLIFANKQDLPGSLYAEEIKEVRYSMDNSPPMYNVFLYQVFTVGQDQDPSLANTAV